MDEAAPGGPATSGVVAAGKAVGGDISRDTVGDAAAEKAVAAWGGATMEGAVMGEAAAVVIVLAGALVEAVAMRVAVGSSSLSMVSVLLYFFDK